jgi:membrane protein DedA with SNARE-associated domain
MSHIATSILDLIKAHPEWAVVLIAFTAFGESFLLVSLLFPGTAILVAAGGLVAAGILDPLQVIAAGILGGMLGDAASFWLGQKFGGSLPKLWPFRQNPERIQSGIDFFVRFGAIGVFLGRFLGPLRETVPTVAGMMRMPAGSFYLANILSAVVWVPALVLSGDLLLEMFRQAELDRMVLVFGAVILALTVAIFWVRRRAPRIGRQRAPD